MKTTRTQQRLTLDDLAKRVHDQGRPILKSGLSKIEAGSRRVDVDDLVALATALDVSPARLLTESPVGDASEVTPGDVRRKRQQLARVYQAMEDEDVTLPELVAYFEVLAIVGESDG